MNRPDGSVLVEAQGSPVQLDGLLQELRFGPSLASVEDLRVTELEPLKSEKGFEIRFG
jgi:acylphosphatase